MFNSQHDCGEDLWDHLTSTRIFSFKMNKYSHMNSKNYESNGYTHNLDLLTSHATCMFQYPTRSEIKHEISFQNNTRLRYKNGALVVSMWVF